MDQMMDTSIRPADKKVSKLMLFFTILRCLNDFISFYDQDLTSPIVASNIQNPKAPAGVNRKRKSTSPIFHVIDEEESPKTHLDLDICSADNKVPIISAIFHFPNYCISFLKKGFDVPLSSLKYSEAQTPARCYCEAKIKICFSNLSSY